VTERLKAVVRQELLAKDINALSLSSEGLIGFVIEGKSYWIAETTAIAIFDIRKA
jgi:hypothetical protein